MDDGALHDALEARGRLGIPAPRRFQALQLVVDEIGQLLTELRQIDTAGLEHRDSILVFRKRQEQVLQRRIFVPALVGKCQSAMQSLLQIA